MVEDIALAGRIFELQETTNTKARKPSCLANAFLGKHASIKMIDLLSFSSCNENQIEIISIKIMNVVLHVASCPVQSGECIHCTKLYVYVYMH